LCSVSVIPANELSLQEIHQLIGINLPIQVFYTSFGSYSQFPKGKIPVLQTLRTPMNRRFWKNDRRY